MPRRITKKLEALSSENLPKRRSRQQKSINDKLASFISSKPKKEEDDELYDNEIINLDKTAQQEVKELPDEPKKKNQQEVKDLPPVTTPNNSRAQTPNSPLAQNSTPNNSRAQTPKSTPKSTPIDKDLLDVHLKNQNDIQKLIQESLKKEILQIKEQERKEKEDRRKIKEKEQQEKENKFRSELLKAMGLREQQVKKQMHDQFIAKAKQARISNFSY